MIRSFFLFMAVSMMSLGLWAADRQIYPISSLEPVDTPQGIYFKRTFNHAKYPRIADYKEPDVSLFGRDQLDCYEDIVIKKCFFTIIDLIAQAKLRPTIDILDRIEEEVLIMVYMGCVKDEKWSDMLTDRID